MLTRTIGLHTALALTAPFFVLACSLDDSAITPSRNDGGTTAASSTSSSSATAGTGTSATTSTGSAGSSSTAATTSSTASTSSSTTAGSGGNSTAGSGGGSTTAGTAGSGGDTGSTVGAGGAGGDTGSTGGAGGDTGSGGMAGAGGDTGSGGMAGSGGSGGGPVTTPTGITLIPTNPTDIQRPSTGGSMFTDNCANPDEVLIGFDASMDSAPDAGGIVACSATGCWLKGASGVCGKLSLSGSAPNFTVTITESGTTTLRGSQGDVHQMVRCPAGTIITGFAGKAGNYIDSITAYCAPVSVVGDATNGFTLQTTGTMFLDPIGGNGGTGFPDHLCADGEAAIGTAVYSGAWFDGFGMNCGKLQLTDMRLKAVR